MKTAISIPDNVFRMADRFARQRKVSRSALFTAAIEEYLAHRRRDDVSERLNRVYAATNSTIDQNIHAIQCLSLSKEQW